MADLIDTRIDLTKPLMQLTVHRDDQGWIQVEPLFNGIHDIVAMCVLFGQASQIAHNARQHMLERQLIQLYNAFHEMAVEQGLLPKSAAEHTMGIGPDGSWHQIA